MNGKVNYRELSVERALLGLPDTVKATSETSPNPRVSFFQREPWCEIDVMPNVDFPLSTNGKD